MTATTDGLDAAAVDGARPLGPAAAPTARRLDRVAGSGWVPTVLVVAFAATVLRFYGVSLVNEATFGAYLVLGIMLPGTLVWRLLYRGSGSFVADVACGTALGYAGEVFAYIPARTIGVPLLVLVWPVAAVVTFVAVPGLRRYWRSAPDRERPPLLWAWSLSGTAALLVFFSVKFFRRYGLSWPGYSAPDTDSTFHLALVGEAKHHMLMTIPWVSGEPLYYHWFVYADMAATSWVTGIEPQVLLLRLSLLPMFVASAVLLAVLARKLFGNWWTGPVAVVVSMFVLAIDPYRWQLSGFYTNLGFNTIDDGGSLRLTSFTSPTQTFGAMLFLPVVLLVVDLLRGHHRDRRRWIALVLMLAAVMGGKATYIPLLLAALCFVVVGGLVTRRGWHRPALAVGAVSLVFVVFAQYVLLGGSGQGLGLTPLYTEKTSGIGSTTGFTHDPRMSRLLVLALISAWCWLCIWSGVFGLLRRRRLFEPEILLLLGLGITGMGGTALLGQAGDAQMYFIQSVRPFLALAAVGGLMLLVRDGRPRRQDAYALVGAAAVGALAVLVVRRLGSVHVPTVQNTGGVKHLAVALLWPYALTVAVAVAAAVVVWLARRRVPAVRGIGFALIVALLAGFGLATAASDYTRIVRESNSAGWREAVAGYPLVSKGTLEAGRWLRDHSDPNDLVATNAHCVKLSAKGGCLNLHFSESAYSERRMLVEGWGFTTTSHEQGALKKVPDVTVPYWKPQVLADNDAAFATPSPQTVDLLRDRYGVKWLFVDDTQLPYSPDLGKFATLRFTSGDCAIYQIRPADG